VRRIGLFLLLLWAGPAHAADPGLLGLLGSDAVTSHTMMAGSPPGDPARPVRLPGERGLALKTRQLAQGVALQSDIMPALRSLASRLGVPMPAQP